MKKHLFKTCIILGFLLVLPRVSFAAQFFFETVSGIYGVRDTVRVDVLLDTQSEIVNTISGEIVFEGFSGDSMKIVDGNSSVLFWIEKPQFIQEKGTVSFSGITPGGIQGSKLHMFTLVFSGEYIEDEMRFSVGNTEILLHDGVGTKQAVGFLPKNIFVSDNADFNLETPLPSDNELPEDFTPAIVQDQNLYDGKFVLVFATQDKGSGIDRFEVKEGYLGSYVEAESPYVLQDQKSFKTIFVKAIDGEGNERVAIVHPQKKIFDENFIVIFSILLVLIILVIIVYRKRRS